MRFCIPIPCFFGGLDFCEAIKKVSYLGFDAAETYNWKGLDAERVRSVCKEYNVELLSMCTTEFCMTEPDNRKKWLSGLLESCKAARSMGVERLITQVGQDTGRERAYQHESIVTALKEAKPILTEFGVTLMIEPLNALVNHPGYYLTSSGEAFDIVREVDSAFTKVVYDIYHQQITEGNIIPTIRDNIDCIEHLHAAGHPGRGDLQFGETDYKVVFAAADAVGFSGACGLEYTSKVYPPDESLVRFKRIYM